MRVVFTGYMELNEVPDDRGSIDNWLSTFLVQQAGVYEDDETGLENLHRLHIKWELKP